MKSILFTPLLAIILISFTNCSTGQQQTIETDPVNITAQAVLNRYISEIGGKELFESVKDRTTLMTGTAMGQPVSIEVMQKYPDKLFQQIRAGEMTQMIYYNSEKGLMIAGDEKVPIEGKELERLKFDATLHLLLDPESYGLKTELESNVIVDSINCYKVTFTLPSGVRWFQYYSSESGLKIKDVKEIQTTQGVFEQETYFSDYGEVSGLKFPFTIRQQFGLQELDLTVTSVEINSGIGDEVFEIPE